MKRLLKVALLVMVASYFVGCAMVMSPATGMVYTETKGPIAYGQNVPAAKTGEACMTAILFISTGDASIEAAMKSGGITSVRSIDGSYTGILGVYGKFCTIVKGS